MDAANRKEQILNAATILFAEKGYTETSMREIANMVDIKAGSIYAHFPSKNSILQHILQMQIDYTEKSTPSIEEIEEMIDREDPATIMRRLFYRYSRQDIQLYSRILKIILQEQYRVPEVRTFVKEYFFRSIQEYIGSVLHCLVERGKIAPIPVEIYTKMILAVNVATTVEFAHYPLGEYPPPGSVSRYDTLDFIIHQIVSIPC